jgi:hypothetical protein
VLPSAASLVALRRTGRPSAAVKPMFGFANPLLDGNQNDPKDGAWYKEQAQLARARTGCAPTPRQRTAVRRAVGRSAAPVPQAAGLADLAHLKVQDPLPETADEVCEVARSVGAAVAEMRIGARATETEIKRLSAAGELALPHPVFRQAWVARGPAQRHARARPDPDAAGAAHRAGRRLSLGQRDRGRQAGRRLGDRSCRSATPPAARARARRP